MVSNIDDPRAEWCCNDQATWSCFCQVLFRMIKRHGLVSARFCSGWSSDMVLFLPGFVPDDQAMWSCFCQVLFRMIKRRGLVSARFCSGWSSDVVLFLPGFVPDDQATWSCFCQVLFRMIKRRGLVSARFCSGWSSDVVLFLPGFVPDDQAEEVVLHGGGRGRSEGEDEPAARTSLQVRRPITVSHAKGTRRGIW